MNQNQRILTNRMGGRGHYCQLKMFLKLLLAMLAIAINVIAAAVPHSYVTENPDKEITQTDTLKKYKDKAELNISVTKISSRELNGIISETDKKIIISLPEELLNKDLKIVEELQDFFNPIGVSENLIQEIEGDILIISYNVKPKILYVSDLKNYYKIKLIPSINRSTLTPRISDYLGTLYDRNFDELGWGDRYFDEIIFDSKKEYGKNTLVKKVSGKNKVKVGHTQSREGHLSVVIEGYEKNGTLVYTSERLGTVTSYSTGVYQWAEVDWDITLPDYYVIVMKAVGYTGDPRGDNSNGDNSLDIAQVLNVRLDDVKKSLEGTSTLTVNEYYPVNEFIKFTGTTTDQGKKLSLENNLKDVSLSSSGEGIVYMEQKDILEINGIKHTITAGGTLTEQTTTVGNITYTYKVEAGKLRIALNNWGVLEPNRSIPIRVYRVQEGQEEKIVDHTLIIKAPRRVEGISNLKFNEAYFIRDIVKLQGISLTAPSVLNLETPIPPGVSLKQLEGYGIPFLKEGDILELGNNTTREIKQYSIKVGGNLEKTFVDLTGASLTVYAENEKLRLGLNNWSANQKPIFQIKVIRGTNEICNMQLGLEVPEAPYNIVKKGILDFGTILTGSKNKYAEADIVLEMLQEVGEVKYSLSTTAPELENSNGEKLTAKEVKAVVLKQAGKRYLVKIQGYLDVPVDQQLGEYRGSMLLNVEVK